jgi:hypothetical protein
MTNLWTSTERENARQQCVVMRRIAAESNLEGEAVAAWAKLQKYIERYSFTDHELQQDFGWRLIELNTERTRDEEDVRDRFICPLLTFSSCHGTYYTNDEGHIVYKFVGPKNNIALLNHLYIVITRAIDQQEIDFRNSPEYRSKVEERARIEGRKDGENERPRPRVTKLREYD